MVVCPYCQQDYVWEVNIRDLPGPSYMCFECDTVWLVVQDLSDQKGRSFEDFMKHRGRTPDWEAITKIKRINGISGGHVR
jgi:hypothetical protein